MKASANTAIWVSCFPPCGTSCHAGPLGVMQKKYKDKLTKWK